MFSCFHILYGEMIKQGRGRVHIKMQTFRWQQSPTSEHRGPPHSCSSSSPLGAPGSCRALTSITETGLWLHSLPTVLIPADTRQDAEKQTPRLWTKCAGFCLKCCTIQKFGPRVFQCCIMLQNFKIVLILLLVHLELTKYNCPFVGQYLPQLTVLQLKMS